MAEDRGLSGDGEASFSVGEGCCVGSGIITSGVEAFVLQELSASRMNMRMVLLKYFIGILHKFLFMIQIIKSRQPFFTIPRLV
jgi:hypothetical protein